MRTRASFKGHPIHQMLIPFPIAFLVGALIFDLIGSIVNDLSFWISGAYLTAAGILMGVLAAIPGFIDYLFSVPPNSTGKKRATKHMIVNLTAVSLFFISLLIRLPFENKPELIVISIEIIGIGFLTMGGWMGGTLVVRNFIGPEHRYPHAGKWNETLISDASKLIKAATVDELKTDQMKLLIINNKRVVLAKTKNSYAAFDDSCTHRGGSLADGIMICGTVQCLWHGSQFDVSSGMVKAGPAEKNISIYETEIKNGDVYIKL